jgi:hypothetical protein
MTGKIKLMIDEIVQKRSKGNATIAASTRTKLILKGIDIQKYSSFSEDDPRVIAQLQAIAAEMGL